MEEPPPAVVDSSAPFVKKAFSYRLWSARSHPEHSPDMLRMLMIQLPAVSPATVPAQHFGWRLLDGLLMLVMAI
eukprot:5397223-Pyramimonas_sp.AAC.1